MRTGKTTVAIVVPPGFGDAAGQAFFGGGARSRSSTCSTTPRTPPSWPWCAGILTQHVMQAVSAEMFGGDQGRRLTQQSLDQLQAPGAHAGRRSQGARRHAGVRQPLVRARAGVAALPARLRRPPRGLTMPYDVARAGGDRAGAGSPTTASPIPSRGWACSSCSSRASTSPSGCSLERQLGLWKRLRAAPISRATSCSAAKADQRRDHRAAVAGGDLRVRDGGLRHPRRGKLAGLPGRVRGHRAHGLDASGC